jgi:hypothetical protein
MMAGQAWRWRAAMLASEQAVCFPLQRQLVWLTRLWDRRGKRRIEEANVVHGSGEHAEEDAGRLGLVELIRALRSELFEAAQAGGGSELIFDVGPIDLDLEVAVTKGGKGNVGVQFWVFTASGGGSYQSAHTQKLHLQLTPKARSGTDWVVNDTGTGLPVQGRRPGAPSGASG